jgi:hypothetical protein
LKEVKTAWKREETGQESLPLIRSLLMGDPFSSPSDFSSIN